jgi:ubiquinone/menaquinone biosynthesis C-methylase UbiE
MKKDNNDIFNKNEYFDYINNNLNLSECQKKMLIDIYNSKFDYYVNQKSNKQFNSYMKEAMKNDNIEQITRLQLLFIHFSDFISFKLSLILIDLLKTNKKISDTDIINYIIKYNEENKHVNKKIDKSICDKWNYAIQYLSIIYKKYYKQNKLMKDIKYLDICCGTGKKTGLFSKYFELKKEHTYCTDIETWGPYKNKTKSKMPYQFKYITNGKLDYAEHTFELCTCILSLHHIIELDNFISEIYRIIKPGGFFILIEHTVFTDYDRMFINIQHMLYSVFFDKKTDYINDYDYIHCYNMYEWDYIMKKHGFQLKMENYLPFDTKSNINYDNCYFAFYRKI